MPDEFFRTDSRGKFFSKLEDVARNTTLLLQAHGERRPGYGSFCDEGLIYTAPFSADKTVTSDHLVIPDNVGRVGDFYAIVDGIGVGSDSNGYVASLAASIAFMKNAYRVLQSAESGELALQYLMRFCAGDVVRASNEYDERIWAGMDALLLVPSKDCSAVGYVANIGHTRTIVYRATTRTYEVLTNKRGICTEDELVRNAMIGYGGRLDERAFSSLNVLAIKLNVGDEVYLMTDGAWRSLKAKDIDGARMIRGSIHQSVESLIQIAHEREIFRHGTDCAIIGVRFLGVDSTSDPKAIYVNEIKSLAKTTLSLPGLTAGQRVVVAGLLPPAIKDRK